MLEGKYKIIRDKTLKELQQRYQQVLYKKLNSKDFKYHLRLRLKEEVAKLLNAENKIRFCDKIADIYEVLECIIKEEKIKKSEIDDIKKIIKKEKGGFDKKYLLISLEE